ncbi:kinesin-like protein KIN-7E [Impatiens glandulifera]|uniref:kinesin-like protein KIN-7E n=1 Tax=Impatiens glandulifera TaxID=253017 RepID=UPI001FB10F29|nr:kinesin-like protein KIN-7E [Impatiens glandulifera]
MGTVGWDSPNSNGHEEKIFVSVRLRPLNARELAVEDVSDWECIDNNTIIYKNSPNERSLAPTAYTFDRVFASQCSTRQVYNEGAKDVALAVTNGINSTIFAYGQTGSGKTYTMSSITEYTVSDIFAYVQKNCDREFVLKLSAMEIYNEAVRDLLNPDTIPLRLLDDPEKGTVVEKLTEESLRDWNHLKELLDFCQSQRHIGETALNEISSRSHQILRLTVESSARKFTSLGNSNTLTASVNFVDLAGSERASQTLSAGTRLKEGSHINRSLLTLGTVIRKLSKGRNGHIPFRDSKLTRILQNSLGGNARTAIICTMSPAHSHVEQSRNALLFAICAKEISTSARVNLVISDKALVKKLRKELARLESEMKNFGSMASSVDDSEALLKEKEILIEKMHQEINELKRQRDQAQYHVQDLLQSSVNKQEKNGKPDFQEDQSQSSVVSRRTNRVSRSQVQAQNVLKPNSLETGSSSPSSEVIDNDSSFRSDVDEHVSQGSNRVMSRNSTIKGLEEECEDNFLSGDITPITVINELFGPDPIKDWEENMDEERADNGVQYVETEQQQQQPSSAAAASTEGEHTYEALKEKIAYLQKTIDSLMIEPYQTMDHQSSSCFTSESGRISSRSLKLPRSRSCRALSITSPWYEEMEQNGNTTPFWNSARAHHQQTGFSGYDGEEIESPVKQRTMIPYVAPPIDELSEEISGEADAVVKEHKDPHVSVSNHEKEEEEEKELEGPVHKQEHEQEQEQEKEEDSNTYNWAEEFEKQRRQIIELWDACDVPLIHRTQFLLLFKGDSSDSVYMEVELRRLSFIHSALMKGTRIVVDGQVLKPSIRKKEVERERRSLTKQMSRILTDKERESLFEKFGIALNTKRRRIQLSNRLWSDAKDMNHVMESASVVAKLFGVSEDDQTPKEMFGLSFSRPAINNRSLAWRHSMSF